MTADTRFMARQERHKQPWWELPAKAPGEPHYVLEREQLRAELARAWRAVSDNDRQHVRTRVDYRGRPAAA